MTAERTEPTLDAEAPARRSLGRNRAALPASSTADEDGVIPDEVASQKASGGPRQPGVDLDALLVEVFQSTGVKVTADDPLVAAAMIQSSLVLRAGSRASEALQEAVVGAVAALAEAVKAERETVANIDRSITSAVAQISEAAKTASAHELGAMKASFARAAAHALDQVSRQASLSRGAIAWRMGACLAAGLAAGLVSGTLLVKLQAPQLSPEQRRLIHNGLILDTAWPKLPPSARSAMEPPKPPPSGSDGGKPPAR
jgi:hypothetical protein